MGAHNVAAFGIRFWSPQTGSVNYGQGMKRDDEVTVGMLPNTSFHLKCRSAAQAHQRSMGDYYIVSAAAQWGKTPKAIHDHEGASICIESFIIT